ncbi:hypothetical protein CVIRNUC_002830 [Coccomyxa viridis]|uniref:Uncharacterized protein n=1 Tax=Coccomyxa viridis TaxID=1274662 RepID=A0AAV1HWW8_9CHLO|nr:hypothetical protein CVIRNUC_002830 [Coccomyxa viridis]
MMSNSSDVLPYAVVIAAALALFTPGMYAPGLGFLMFAVGINLRPEAFKKVFMSPKVSCVSGAQLSNYATFLLHPEQAPLSIVLTALSTAAGVFMTPVLALILLGARIPVDARGMALSITQIVLVPVLAGLMCSTYFPAFVTRAKPFLTLASLLDTCACVGASLASNSDTARSSLGAAVLVPVAVLHIAAYYLGYRLARATVAAENVPLARCISLESGMQSSLLGLLLASRFFHDPLVSLPCGISTIFMTLSGFGLVMWWKRKGTSASQSTTPAAW